MGLTGKTTIELSLRMFDTVFGSLICGRVDVGLKRPDLAWGQCCQARVLGKRGYAPAACGFAAGLRAAREAAEGSWIPRPPVPGTDGERGSGAGGRVKPVRRRRRGRLGARLD